jgi:hypothetical protein
METWFLGVIALCSVVQAVFLIGLAVFGLRLSRRLGRLQESLDREIRPSLEHVSRVTRNLTEVSDLAVLQARRLDDLVADTIDKVEEATTLVRRFVVRPVRPLSDVVAFFKGLRRGLEVYRRLSEGDDERRGSSRRYADDEHLFI